MRNFLLIDEGKSPATVERMIRRLARAERVGLDVAAFDRDAESARRAGRAYLARRRASATIHAYNNDVKLLSALSRWRGYEIRWTFLRAPRAQFRALTPEQVFNVFAYRCDDPVAERMHRALALVALKTGLRASEIAALNVTDLDATRSRIYVRHPAKGGLRRWIPVERYVWSSRRPLAAWLAVRPVPIADPLALWTTQHKSGGGKYAPGADPARRVSPDYLRNCLYRIGRAVDVPLNFNVARHTRATELIRRGWDIRYIQQYLGHASIASTEIYAEVGEKDVAEMMRKKPGNDIFRDG